MAPLEAPYVDEQAYAHRYRQWPKWAWRHEASTQEGVKRAAKLESSGDSPLRQAGAAATTTRFVYRKGR